MRENNFEKATINSVPEREGEIKEIKVDFEDPETYKRGVVPDAWLQGYAAAAEDLRSKNLSKREILKNGEDATDEITTRKEDDEIPKLGRKSEMPESRLGGLKKLAERKMEEIRRDIEEIEAMKKKLEMQLFNWGEELKQCNDEIDLRKEKGE